MIKYCKEIFVVGLLCVTIAIGVQKGYVEALLFFGVICMAASSIVVVGKYIVDKTSYEDLD